MADHIVKKTVGISFDALVKVDNFISLDDFRIINCEVYFKVSIILGRPFMVTGRVIIDIEKEKLIF